VARSAQSHSATPAPPGLAALAEAAALLAAGESFERALPGVLGAVAPTLGGGHCSVWLWQGGDLRLAAGAADGIDAGGVRAGLAAARTGGLAAVAATEDGPTLHVAPLVVGGHGHGALALTARGTLAPDERLLFETLANMLAPAVAHAEQRRRLQSEVASRTRQIDDERRFTERIIDSLPFGLYVIDRDYRIQVWNRKRETGLQGVSREEAIGRTIYEITSSIDP